MKEAFKLLEKSHLIELQEALDTVLVYIRNLVEFPDEKKFRKIRVANIHYQERLGHISGLRLFFFAAFLRSSHLITLCIGHSQALSKLWLPLATNCKVISSSWMTTK